MKKLFTALFSIFALAISLVSCAETREFIHTYNYFLCITTEGDDGYILPTCTTEQIEVGEDSEKTTIDVNVVAFNQEEFTFGNSDSLYNTKDDTTGKLVSIINFIKNTLKSSVSFKLKKEDGTEGLIVDETSKDPEKKKETITLYYKADDGKLYEYMWGYADKDYVLSKWKVFDSKNQLVDYTSGMGNEDLHFYPVYTEK